MNFDGTAEQCSMAEHCKNSIDNVGERHNKCHMCRLSPSYTEDGLGLPSHWKPFDKKMKHPALEKERRQDAKDRADARKKTRQSKDRKRQALLRKAEHAERRTERNIIKATKNSGRSHQDGDHVMGTIATLDTKLQSSENTLTIRMSELTKVRADAVRAGTAFGALVLTNKNGVSVVAILDRDFASIMKTLREPVELLEVENASTQT